KAHIVGIGIDSGNTLAALMALFRLRTVICIRDYAGHRIFGKMTEPQSGVGIEFVSIDEFSFDVIETKYTEAT
ncbi:MAG TPA: hypothetical protein VJX74_16120, partial [Blastocatellia bacterium]|nr:hypothetical protein [Blastocatellia bacterium]